MLGGAALSVEHDEGLGSRKQWVVYADSSAGLAVAKRKGAGKLRIGSVSSLWIREKQDMEELELRMVLGT